jgi:hypothetical protein
MKVLLVALCCLCMTAKAEAPTDARLFCGSLEGSGAILIPLGEGRFVKYDINCKKGVSV